MSILPTRRLLGLVLAAALVAALAGPFPELGRPWLLGLAALAVVALLDAAGALFRPPALGVSVPPVARFTRGRRGAVRVVFARPPGAAARVRFALRLPPGFESEEPEVWVDLPAGAERAVIDWACRPERRGRFRDVLACLQTNSRLGLWHLRTRQRLDCELRSYLNLPRAGRQLVALPLERSPSGGRLRRTTGRGREFEKLRDYLPGDGFDEIHWKATAKRGRPVTKVFQVEKTQEIYVVIDQSRLSGRALEGGDGTQTVLEGYLGAALSLLLVSRRQGDRFGLIAHDDRVRLFLRAGQSAAHYAACREAALTLEATDRAPDMAEVVRHLCTQLRQRALLFFLTDLSDPVLAEDFLRQVRILSRSHLVFVCQLQPPEVRRLFEGGPVADEREVYGRLAGHLRWSEQNALSRRLSQLGVTTGRLSPDTMASELVGQYMRVKQRQIL